MPSSFSIRLLQVIPKKYALLRYASIGTGVISGFVQIALYTKYLSQENTAILILISGYSIFLNWIDAGLSKPVYPKLRKAYLNGKDVRQELAYLQYFYMALSGVAVFFFAALVLVLGQTLKNSIAPMTLTVMGINLALNTSTSFFKNIFNAIDSYTSFEITELIRRASNIFSTLLLIVDPSLILTAYSQFIIYAAVYYYIMKRLLAAADSSFFLIFKTNILLVRNYMSQYWQETKSYLLFMINETLIYNCSYFIFPLFMTSQQIVIYGIWSRIYSGMATFTRAISDITIHAITESYFQNRIEVAKKLKNRTLLLSITLSLSMLAVFFTLHTHIMKIWVHGQYELSFWALAGLCLWLLGNSVQHVAGTFLVSVGNFFSVIKNISFVLAFSIVCITSSSAWLTRDLGIVLTSTGCIYVLGALIYQFTSQNALVKKAL